MRDLTAAELGIFLGNQTAADASIYNCAELIEFTSPLQTDVFERALRNVLSQVEVLSTRFLEVQGVPKAIPADVALAAASPVADSPSSRWVQRIEAHSIQWNTSDVALPGNAADPRRLAPLSPVLYAPFELAAADLCRHVLIAQDNALHAWLHVAHHIALDGFAFQLIGRNVASEYTALLAGNSSVGVARSVPLREIASADVTYQQSDVHAADAAFFARTPERHFPRARLLGYETVNPETMEAAMPGSASRPLREQARADADSYLLLQATARRLGVSWPEVASVVTAQFVAQASGLKRFALGVPVMLRFGTPKLKVPCMAMNIVRMPVAIGTEQSLSQTLRQWRSRWKEQSPHHRLRYEELNEQSFGPVVNILPFAEDLLFGGIASQATNLSAGPVTDLALMLVPRSEALELTVDGHPALYNTESLSALVRDWAQFIQASLARDADLPQPVGLVQTPQRSSEDSTSDIGALWLSSAAANSSAIAVVHAGESITYAQLRRRVERAANNLRRLLAPNNADCAHCVVALELPRSIEAVTLLLATLQVGACYAFLDPEQPLARRADLLQRLQPDLVISVLPAVWVEAGWRSVSLEFLELETQIVSPRVNLGSDASDPAYVVFTSGSTGTPKGVVVSRGALTAFVKAALQVYPLSGRDRVLQFAPLTFDASVEEIFCTLCVGATLLLRSSEMLDSMRSFAETCRAWRISVLDLPTAFWHEWVESMQGSECRMPELRLMLIGGEAAEPQRVLAFRNSAPSVQLINTYGPSETTVVATFADLTSADLSKGVPIGKPLSSVSVHIVDELGNARFGAAEGELWLTGPQLASGYLRQSSETKAKFVAHGRPPVRAYRTGDRVRCSASGELYFLGRIDHEIKISGYRVSPTEVETLLNTHVNVVASVVTASKVAQQTLLVAHIQPREAAATTNSEAGTDPDLGAALRQFLLQHLPSPMVPTRYVFHSSLPLNASGKVDRRALSALESTPQGPAQVTDRLFTESPGRELLDTWRKVLGRPDAGPDDDFFRLGGHSLQVIQMAARLNAIHEAISVTAIFRCPTPRALLLWVTQSQQVEESSYRDVAPLSFEPRPQASGLSPHAVLVTGATGFVGANLVAELLTRPITLRCLVRGETQALAQNRMLAALEHHHCQLSLEQLARLEVVALDLAQPLSPLAALDHLGHHSLVIHCASEVNLTRSFGSLAPSNVAGTRWLLQYAHAVNARFCYVSTLAVAPAGSERESIPEEIFEAHDALVDGYQQSKWHAEQLCSLAAQQGMDVQVVRLGRVVASSQRTVVNPSDLVWRIARAATRCSYWPDLDFAEVWTAVDNVASIMTQIALDIPRSAVAARTPSVYHIAHQGTVHLERLRSHLVEAGFSLTRCDLVSWLGHVRREADAEDQATLAFFELNAGKRKLPAEQRFDCARLISELPGLDLEPISDSLIERYVAAAIEQKLLSRP